MDNSDWTRNGDYHPSRWDSEVEAANLIAEAKSERNPENSLGIMTMAGRRVEVHVSLTNDLSRVLNSTRKINLAGECDYVTALNIATLTLKYRQNKNQKQRVVLFVGSPIKHSLEEMVQLGKKLKKYNIAIDIISFGHVDDNREILTQFLNQVNNANNSSILEVPVGFYIMDSLFTSPIMAEGGYEGMEDTGNVGNVGNVPSNNVPVNQGNAGGMSQFERDINMAIQQSLEDDKKRAQQGGEQGQGTTTNTGNNQDNVEMKQIDEENEEDLLEQAKLLSIKENEAVEKKKEDDESKIVIYNINR
jgi:26S proteasome regulatory subunit N10